MGFNMQQCCCVGIPVVLSGCAVMLSLFSNFWCISVKFEGNASPDLSFGLWNYKGAALYYDYYGNVYAASKCNGFPSEANLDAKWKTAQAFSIIAFVLGCFGICVAGAVPPPMLKKASSYYFLTTLCQGLTMIHLASDGCKNNQIMAYINEQAGRTLYPDSCKMDDGMILNIVATCCYFVAGLSCLVIPSEYEYEVGRAEQAGEGEGEGEDA